MADAQFVWAKTMDDGSLPYFRDPYPYFPSYARGRSDYNVGKAFKLYGLWQPVFFRGSHGWLEKIVGGWSVSGIFNLHTGFPWTPVFNVPGGQLYFQGGGAWAHTSTNVTVGGVQFGQTSNTRSGWTIGGGVEWMFAPHWSAFLEGNYMDFGSNSGSATVGGVIFPVTAKATESTVLVGVNYRFF